MEKNIQVVLKTSVKRCTIYCQFSKERNNFATNI